jgi:hypothetical protein
MMFDIHKLLEIIINAEGAHVTLANDGHAAHAHIAIAERDAAMAEIEAAFKELPTLLNKYNVASFDEGYLCVAGPKRDHLEAIEKANAARRAIDECLGLVDTKAKQEDER